MVYFSMKIVEAWPQTKGHGDVQNYVADDDEEDTDGEDKEDGDDN